MNPPGWQVSNMLLEKRGGELPIVPECMKWLGQSGYDSQLWMCLRIKVKSDATKNSIVQEPGILDP